MHQPLHGTYPIIGRSAGGEVSLHPGDRCGSGTGNSGQHPGKPPCTSRGVVPEHVVYLYSGASGNYTSSTERQVLVQLLTEYSDIFSRGDKDMGLTKVISYDIPLAAGTTPIRQPTDI